MPLTNRVASFAPWLPMLERGLVLWVGGGHVVGGVGATIGSFLGCLGRGKHNCPSSCPMEGRTALASGGLGVGADLCTRTAEGRSLAR